MKTFYFCLSISIQCFFSPVVFAETITGWQENAVLYLDNQAVMIEAKIDSGADHSSLHATHIQYFERNAKPWVKFETFKQIKTELPLYKKTKIKTKRVGYQQRPVVLISLCLAGIVQQVQMNLVDRAHFSKPLLIGRSALQGFLINPRQTHLTDSKKCRDVDKSAFVLN
ncbi:MAG: RimK/LysX family protein [Thiomicrorhabdus sp.]|nr:RimK/LysX family protein [Thiomicrorhabdus sp.]